MLNSLYRAASVLVYISGYEGFGMPVLEAMALSCPVISSNSSSLPEVCNDAALAVNPANPDELALALDQILGSNSLRTAFIEKGKINATRFTWEKCATETLKCYQSLF